jgi:hypothetical protein
MRWLRPRVPPAPGGEPLAAAFERDPIRTRELWLQQLHRELARVAHRFSGITPRGTEWRSK